MSPTDIVIDILKKQGEWMESSLLLGEVMKERNVSDRQAYRDIKGVCDDGKVRKVELPDDTVYGLSNWPFPTVSLPRQKKETLTFQDAIKYRWFKNLEQITSENIEGNSEKAYSRLFHLKAMLPQDLKKRLNPYFEQAEKELDKYHMKPILPHLTKRMNPYFKELGKYQAVDYPTLVAKHDAMFELVQYLVDKVSTVLHES